MNPRQAAAARLGIRLDLDQNKTANSAEKFPMMTSRRSAIRHCPICRIAMQAAKSRDGLADFDIFRCLMCETTIREAKSHAKARGSAPDD